MLWSNLVNKTVNIPRCKIDSPNSYLHAYFVENCIKTQCKYVLSVDINA